MVNTIIMVAKQGKWIGQWQQVQNDSEFIFGFIFGSGLGWQALSTLEFILSSNLKWHSEFQDGGRLRERLWDCQQCGGTYGVFQRQSMFGVEAQEYSRDGSQRLCPLTATHSRTILNTVFIYTRDLIVPFLGPIFRAMDTLKVYPEDWKLTKTPILKTLGNLTICQQGHGGP